MKGIGVFLGVAALAGLVVASQASSAPAPAGAPRTIEIKPGETWLLTVKAVNGKLGPADEAQLRAMAPSLGTLDSLVIQPDGSMMALVITYHTATKVFLNQLIALTTTPDRGLVIIDATPFQAGAPLPTPPPDPTTPAPPLPAT